MEILLSAPTIASSYGNQTDSGERNAAPNSKQVDNVYMVRDRDHICDLHLSSQPLCPGSDVDVHLDFTDNIQPCSMVRATIILSEVRADGSHIQVCFFAKITLLPFNILGRFYTQLLDLTFLIILISNRTK